MGQRAGLRRNKDLLRSSVSDLEKWSPGVHPDELKAQDGDKKAQK
jgi:hypothetical protein